MSKNEFIELAFTDSEKPEKKTLWLDDQVQAKIKKILHHRYPKLRLKYWQSGNQTVWFMDKIGKERPISFGISIKDQKVTLIKVLAFRESRGGEIRMQAYTEQFNSVGIDADNNLDQTIDGITGATMSVNAMKKITRTALMLAKIVNQ